jgi:hypothetical protein
MLIYLLTCLEARFPNDYDHYKIILEITTRTTNNYVGIRYRASGSDITSSDYQSSYFLFRTNSATTTIDNSGANQSLYSRAGFSASSAPAYGEYIFYNPNKSVNKGFSGLFLNVSNDATEQFVTGGGFDATTVADSLTFFSTSGTFSGKLTAFGFRKS